MTCFDCGAALSQLSPQGTPLPQRLRCVACTNEAIGRPQRVAEAAKVRAIGEQLEGLLDQILAEKGGAA